MSLREDILDRYGSVYKFWRTHKDELPSKGVVYQVAAGKYSGDQAGQEGRMRAVMNGAIPRTTADADKIYAVIRDVACRRCPDKDAPGPRCTGCLELFRLQAKAVAEKMNR